MCQRCSRHHFGVACVRPAKSNVVHHARTEEKCVLQHDANLAPQAFGSYIPHINAINLDRAGAGIVEARQQIDDCSFAGAGRSDDGNCLPGFRVKTDVAQYRGAGCVFGRHIFKCYVAIERGHGACARPVHDGWLLVKQLKDAFTARDGILDVCP